MRMQGLISVIITTCCRPLEIVERAVNSVFQQTFNDWELIVIDDSPETFVERYSISNYFRNIQSEHNVVYLQNNVNIGACSSRNRGLDIAKGEFIAYLDDDDEWLPEKLKLQYQEMMSLSEDVALIYCPHYVINEKNNTKKNGHCRDMTDYIYDKLLQYGNYIGGMSVPLIKTKCIREIGGFDIRMQSSQDYDVWLRLAQRYKIGFVSEPLVNYYLHNGQPQISTNCKKQIMGGELIIEKNLPYLSKNSKGLASRYRILIPHFASEKMYFKAFRMWILTVMKSPTELQANIKALYSIVYRFTVYRWRKT